jgi:hypothetical protein
MSWEGGHSGIVTIVEAIAEEGDKELIEIQMNQPVAWVSGSVRGREYTYHVFPRSVE